MKLIEYKPHDKWFIWIHPCYLVQTTKHRGGGVMEIIGRYYYGRTHLTMRYFHLEMLDRIKRQGGNFPSMRGTKFVAEFDPFAQELNDPNADEITAFTLIHFIYKNR